MQSNINMSITNMPIMHGVTQGHYGAKPSSRRGA